VRRLVVPLAGGFVGIFVPFLVPGYQGTLAAVVIAGLLGAILASVIWEGLTLG
jgi:hypothetical protein